MAVSVTCADADETCAYQLQIDMLEWVDGAYEVIEFDSIQADDADDEGFVPPPPGPIITEDYTNGRLVESN